MKTIEIETPLRRLTVSKAERRIAEAHQPTKIQRTSHFCIICHAEWTLEIIICFIKEDHNVSVYTGPSSAFEKWSGHVEPKGSRMGVFMDIPEKKIEYTISRSDFVASESLGLRQMSILQASYRDFCW